MRNKELGDIVARGRTADIHTWGEGQVVKLYHDWFLLPWIKNEASRTAVINQLPLPVPKVGELLEINGRNGLEFEHLDGKNMLELLDEDSSLGANFAKRLAQLQIKMHRLDVDHIELRSQREKLVDNIGRAAPLSDEMKQMLLAQLEQLPDGQSLCHGDFHPGNIVVAAGQEYIVDWNDCSLGNPLADLARSTILFIGGITGNEEPNPEFEALVTAFHDHYLYRYLELYSADEAEQAAARAEYEQWLPIIAGARLCEGITT
ncbi:MAG: aminoglycoside phosphotransferase family protein, partial [Chloroflexota bacterium]